ncbi:MAG: hypothetical protein Q8M22_00020 [Actinomycetota bacterium]|nr:hypothetical protein [Actinomycetota bacterium]
MPSPSESPPQPQPAGEPLRDRGTRRALWLLAATVFLASCLVTHPGTGWNVNTRLALVFAVVDRGELTIDAYHDTPPTTTQDKAVFEGHYYSDKVIGLAALAVPVYGLIRVVEEATGTSAGFQAHQYLLTRVAVSLPAAIAAVLLASLLIVLGGRPRRAVLVTAGVVFGSMWFGYSTIFYPYLPGIALCLGALFVALTKPLTLRRAVAVGGLLGTALVFDFNFAITVAIIAALAVAEVWRRPPAAIARLCGAAAATAAVPLLAFAAYSTHIFGSPTIPYRYEELDYFREGMQQGVMGVTSPKPNAVWFLSVHPYRGILFWSPWLVIVGICAVRLIRSGGLSARIGAASLAAFVGYFLFNAGYYQWWAGGAMGPRLMVPMLAVVPLALVVCCRPDCPRWLLRALTITMSVAVALSLPLSLVDPQLAQGNTNEVLEGARIGTSLHIGQFEVLHRFYTFDWAGLKPVWGPPVGVSFVLTLLVIAGGIALADRAARTAELPDVAQTSQSQVTAES